jgi:hypothetical protein
MYGAEVGEQGNPGLKVQKKSNEEPSVLPLFGGNPKKCYIACWLGRQGKKIV